jgi:hypothetical protein
LQIEGNVHPPTCEFYHLERMNIWLPYFGARTTVQRFLLVLALIGVLLALASVSSTFTFDTALRAFGKGKEYRAWWVVFGLPFVATILGWVGFWRNRKGETDKHGKILALLSSTLAASLAVGEITYVQFVTDLSWQEGGFLWGWTLLLSFAAFIAGLLTIVAPRWYCVLTLAASSWLLVVCFLSGMSI